MSGKASDSAVEAVVRARFGGKPITQLAFLVEDLADSVAAWSGVYGAEDWLVFTYGPDNVRTLRFDGTEGDFRFRVALAGTGPQLELIQPLSGHSMYEEWIAEHGYGLHHVAFRVDSIADTIAAFEEVGVTTRQVLLGQGLHGDGGSAYFELDGYGVLVEALEVPAVRRASEGLPPGRSPA